MRTGYGVAKGRRGSPLPALVAGHIRKAVYAPARNGLCRIWGLPRLPRRRKGRIGKAARALPRQGRRCRDDCPLPCPASGVARLNGGGRGTWIGKGKETRGAWRLVLALLAVVVLGKHALVAFAANQIHAGFAHAFVWHCGMCSASCSRPFSSAPSRCLRSKVPRKAD